MLGLAEKKKPSARRAARSSSSRLLRTLSTVQSGLPIWRWFTHGPASTTARSSNSKKSRPFRGVWHDAVTYGDLLLNPCWDSLRGDKRFDKIVAAAKAASK